MKPGDFTLLATNYSRSRPGYSKSVLNSIMGCLAKSPEEMEFIDVGAGTGIWTRMLAELNPRSCSGVEPNKVMLSQAKLDSSMFNINWINSAAESIPVEDSSFDYLSMASSFHWTDFLKAIYEFRRVLRQGAAFTLLWNPRQIEHDSKLLEIENWLEANLPNRRVSSGLSGVTIGLTERLERFPFVKEVLYIEGKQIRTISLHTYIDAWRSVNDVQSQLGEYKFEEFIDFIKSKFSNQDQIEVVNLTRSWTAILS